MMIETLETKDPNILNFFPPKEILCSGTTEFKDSKSARRSPLAENIFDIGEIESILITSDMLSVTKKEDADWSSIKPLILAEIMDFVSTGQQMLTPESNDDEETVKKIKGLINARIRSAIQQDGGDIIFKKFEGGIVYVELTGNCSGCPYAMTTLKDGVEKLLKHYIPEIKSVENLKNGD